MRCVVIDWLDSSRSDGWTTKLQSDTDSLAVRSIGYVLQESEDRITIAGHIASHSWCGEIVIPKIAIIKIRELKKEKL